MHTDRIQQCMANSQFFLYNKIFLTCPVCIKGGQFYSRLSWISASSKHGNHSPGTLHQHQDISYFILLAEESKKSLNSSGQSFFQRPFRVAGFGSSMDSLILTMQSAILYNFQHSLTQMSHLHPRYCTRCSKSNSSWKLWWFPGWVATGVSCCLTRHSCWIFRWIKPRSYR